MGVSKNSGTPKWIVYNGKPYENGWFGGTTIFRNPHIVSIIPPNKGRITRIQKQILTKAHRMMTRKKTGVMDLLTVSTKTEIRGTRSPEIRNRALSSLADHEISSLSLQAKCCKAHLPEKKSGSVIWKSNIPKKTDHADHAWMLSLFEKKDKALRYWTKPAKRKTIMKQLANKKLLQATASASNVAISNTKASAESSKSDRPWTGNWTRGRCLGGFLQMILNHHATDLYFHGVTPSKKRYLWNKKIEMQEGKPSN